jgi:hypothetical protein
MRRALVGFAILVVFGGAARAAEPPRFEDFQVDDVDKGPTRVPDFEGRDRAFANYKTQISEGLKEGPNFAGHYSVIQIGCGTGCSRAYIADSRNGQVFAFPRGGEDHFMLDLTFEPSSRLLKAQWADFDNDDCVLEFFEWEGAKASVIQKTSLGDKDACM